MFSLGSARGFAPLYPRTYERHRSRHTSCSHYLMSLFAEGDVCERPSASVNLSPPELAQTFSTSFARHVAQDYWLAKITPRMTPVAMPTNR